MDMEGADTLRVANVAQRYRLKDGTISLINKIVEDGGYEVRLSSPVAAVRQSDTGVAVTTEDGKTLNPRFVVVAVPVNTLNSIDFQPKLMPEKQNMSRERHAGIGMQHRGVLDVAVAADADLLGVAAHDAAVPDAGVLGQFHLAHHLRVVGDPGAFCQLRRHAVQFIDRHRVPWGKN